MSRLVQSNVVVKLGVKLHIEEPRAPKETIEMAVLTQMALV